MDRFIQPVDMVTRLDRQLLDAIDAPAGWSDVTDHPESVQTYTPPHQDVDPDARQMRHANGAALRFWEYSGSEESREGSTVWQARLTHARVAMQDGQGVVVVEPSWVPFGGAALTNLMTVPTETIAHWLHHHAGTLARRRQRWGRKALILALTRQHPDAPAQGAWVLQSPGYLSAWNRSSPLAFVLPDIVHPPRFGSPVVLQVMSPDMTAAVRALGLDRPDPMHMTHLEGRPAGIEGFGGISVALGETAHDRMRILAQARAYLEQEPSCPTSAA